MGWRGGGWRCFAEWAQAQPELRGVRRGHPSGSPTDTWPPEVGAQLLTHGRARAHTRARAHVLKTYRTGGAGTTLATAGRLIPPALGTGALSGRNKRPQAARGLSATRAPFSLAAPLLMLARHCGAPALTGDCRARISEPHAGPSPRVARGLPGAEKQGQARRSSLTASGFRSRRSRASAPFSGLRFLSQRGRGAGWLSARTLCLS